MYEEQHKLSDNSSITLLSTIRFQYKDLYQIYYPIHYALLYENNVNIFKYVVKNNQNLINLYDNNGYAPLHYLSNCNINIITFLIKNGANVNILDIPDNFCTKTIVNSSPLHLYVRNIIMTKQNGGIICEENKYFISILKYLIKKGANVNICDSDGKSVIDYIKLYCDSDFYSSVAK